MLAFISFVPILTTLVLMAVFNTPAKKALPISFFICVLSAFFIWKMDFSAIEPRLSLVVLTRSFGELQAKLHQ